MITKVEITFLWRGALILILALLFLVIISSCGSDGLSITLGGNELKGEAVFSDLDQPFELAVDSQGVAYVELGIPGELGFGILRLSPNGEIETILQSDDDLEYPFGKVMDLQRRPGSDEVYIKFCSKEVDGKRKTRIFRIEPDLNLNEISEDYYSGLSQDKEDEIGINDCPTPWAIDKHGNFLFASLTGIWRLSPDGLEQLRPDWLDFTGNSDFVTGSLLATQNENEVIWYRYRPPLNPDNPLPTVLRIKPTKVEEISYLAEIYTGAVDYNGGIYLILPNSDTEKVQASEGIRLDGGTEEVFFDGGEFRISRPLAFDPQGDLYLVHGTNSPLGNAFSEWNIFQFETSDIIEKPAD